MAKIGLITDTHFGARGDSGHMQQSMKKFFSKVFFPTLDQYGVTRVLHGGDYVDRRKYVNYQTARFIREEYRDPLVKRNITEDVVLGNHDIYYRNTTALNAVEELYRGDYHGITLHLGPTEIDVDGTGMLLVPWIADNNREDALKALTTSTCSIVLGHFEIQGFQMFRGMPSMAGLSPKLFDRFEVVMSGHYHHKSNFGPIHYLGAPYPMIWSDYHDPRGFHLFDTDSKELTFIPNPYSIFCRIVYDDANQKHDYIKNIVQQINEPDSDYHDAYVKIVVKSKTQPYWFDLMMDALYRVNAQDIIVVDDIIINDDESETEVESPDVDTLTLMRDYVESTSISCDKNELFSYLQTKYQESVAATQSSRLT